MRHSVPSVSTHCHPSVGRWLCRVLTLGRPSTPFHRTPPQTCSWGPLACLSHPPGSSLALGPPRPHEPRGSCWSLGRAWVHIQGRVLSLLACLALMALPGQLASSPTQGGTAWLLDCCKH